MKSWRRGRTLTWLAGSRRLDATRRGPANRVVVAIVRRKPLPAELVADLRIWPGGHTDDADMDLVKRGRRARRDVARVVAAVMSEAQAGAFGLHYYERRPVSEIASLMDQPVDAVRQTVEDAVNRVRFILRGLASAGR